MKNVSIELSARLAELAGFHTWSVPVAECENLTDVIRRLEERLESTGRVALLRAGKLHPSILVSVDESSGSGQGDSATVLRGGETIALFLPVAGG